MKTTLMMAAVVGLAAMGCAATESAPESANVTPETGIATKYDENGGGWGGGGDGPCQEIFGGCATPEPANNCASSCESPGYGYELVDACTCEWELSIPDPCFGNWSCSSTTTTRTRSCYVNYRGQLVCF